MSKIVKLENLLGIQMSQTILIMRSFLVKEFENRKSSIRFEDWMNLYPVYLNEGLSQKELSDFLVRDKTTVSRIVDGWEKKGFIKREYSLEDKRRMGIYFTPQGKKRWKSAEEIVNDLDKIFISRLKNLDDFLQALGDIRASILRK
ncbi:MarR family transcriptional regulator [Leptospira sp. 96542]|nr:MarR family transcriptional regulator [Leptospira sp. 96542]